MPQRPEQSVDASEFVVPDLDRDALTRPDVELSAEVRRPARVVPPVAGPPRKGPRPDRATGRGQRAGKGRNYQFRRS